jgi:hypothetical protein
MKTAMKDKKLNSVQLRHLRNARSDGRITGDRCTLKALHARGYATSAAGMFFITDVGLERAIRAADVEVRRDGATHDPTLMEDCWRCDDCGHYVSYHNKHNGLRCENCGKELF